MKILVIGGDGSEQAVLWRLSRSPRRPRLFVAGADVVRPGVRRVDVDVNRTAEVVGFAETERIDLTVCTSEKPAVRGLSGAFQHAGLPVLGPSRLAGLLGYSRTYAKAVIANLELPVPSHRTVPLFSAAHDLGSIALPCVAKADLRGPHPDVQQVESADELSAFLGQKTTRTSEGDAAVILEESIAGPCVFAMAFTDGISVSHPVLAAEIRGASAGTNDPFGPVAGVVSPAPGHGVESMVLERFLAPVARGLRAQGISHRGPLGVRVVLGKNGPVLTEVRAGFGEPIAQTVLPRLRTDLVDILLALLDDRLSDQRVEWDTRPSVCVVMRSSKGSPADVCDPAPRTIASAEEIAEGDVLVCGRSSKDATGVKPPRITVSAVGSTVEAARTKVYGAIERIGDRPLAFRDDIGQVTAQSSVRL